MVETVLNLSQVHAIEDILGGRKAILNVRAAAVVNRCVKEIRVHGHLHGGALDLRLTFDETSLDTAESLLKEYLAMTPPEADEYLRPEFQTFNARARKLLGR